MSSKFGVIMMIDVAFVLVGAFALSTRFTVTMDSFMVKERSSTCFEGGFYGIVGDDGKYYDPIGMPQEFEVDGLRVRFAATITGYMSNHMWGYVVRLVSIERLP